MNPAAAAVDKIVRECAEKVSGHHHGAAIISDTDLIHRAVREAIAATGAREALSLVDLNFQRANPDDLYDDDHEAWCATDKALANLDAVLSAKHNKS